ncbi:hypothetical protein GCM10010442_73790 [Kitasatospora kifunensis]
MDSSWKEACVIAHASGWTAADAGQSARGSRLCVWSEVAVASWVEPVQASRSAGIARCGHRKVRASRDARRKGPPPCLSNATNLAHLSVLRQTAAAARVRSWPIPSPVPPRRTGPAPSVSG